MFVDLEKVDNNENKVPIKGSAPARISINPECRKSQYYWRTNISKPKRNPHDINSILKDSNITPQKNVVIGMTHLSFAVSSFFIAKSVQQRPLSIKAFRLQSLQNET